MNQFDIPGCKVIGYIAAENFNGGRPVPLFESVAPPGQTSINTLEGWNAAVNKQNRRYFLLENGREPVDAAELDCWAASMLYG